MLSTQEYPRENALLVNERQVAASMNVSLATVRRWRANGQGPKFVRLGGSIRYALDDLRIFVEGLRSGGER
ncbi:MAG: helix-turn-helix domain-containing protein [Acidobacteria bacterium]|nr:helix-turn-helix domain-containing protein [Acidobacteriota bacterium]